MDLIISIQQGKLNDLRHKILGFNMKNCDTQSQVQSEQRARHVNRFHRVKGFYLRTKELKNYNINS